MRELERETLPSPLSDALDAAPLAIVGSGRVGGSLARAAEAVGIKVRLAGREDAAEACAGTGAALICVPDAAIGEVREAIAVAAPPLVGHVSGATGLDALELAGDTGSARFSIHPLQTFADEATPVDGTPCAVAGSSERALRFATSLGDLTGPIARGDRDTVERQRAALGELAPELLPMYEALAERAAAQTGEVTA